MIAIPLWFYGLLLVLSCIAICAIIGALFMWRTLR